MSKMSIPEYAKHRGVSETAVYKALNEGRISLQSDTIGKRFVDSEVADKEWYANTDSVLARDAAAAMLEHTADEILGAEDDTEIEEETDEGETVEIAEGQKRLAKKTAEKAEVRLSLDSARAKEKSFQAELARLKFEEQAGILVNAQEVQDEAFKLGRTIRDALKALPDRVASEFAAESNAFNIHKRLGEEIDKALVSLMVEYNGPK